MDPKVGKIQESADKLQQTLSSISKSKPKNAAEAETQMGYLVGELESLKSEIDNLDKTVVLGAPLSEYGGNLEKLASAEQSITELEAKIELMIEKMAEVRKDQEMLKSLLQEGISEKQVQALESRIKNIEGLQQTLMSSKSTKVMVELVRVMDELNNRVKRIEELFKVSKLSEASKYSRSDASKYSRVQKAEQQAPPAKKEGALAKIKRLF